MADVDLLLTAATLSKETGRWPLGSVWFDPDAQAGGAPTLAATELTTALTDLPSTTAFARAPGFRKAVLSTPSGAGGTYLLIAAEGIGGNAGNNANLELKFNTDAAGGMVAPITRVQQTVGGTNLAVSFYGFVTLAAGETAEVWVEYRYSTAPGTNLNQVRYGNIMVVYFPGAVASGGTADPMTRYWDGDSWRPAQLDGAAIDLSGLSTTPPPAKTSTTTSIARSPSSLNAGGKVTLTATITPSTVTGTVTFYRGTSSSGPWTSLGAVSVAVPPATGGTATKTWTTSDTTSGTFYFKAVYNGSTVYATSSAVSGATTVNKALHTETKTFAAQWVQAYKGNGDKLTGTGHDSATHQGVHYDGAGSGNRRSLVAFNVSLPDDAEVSNVVLSCNSWPYWDRGSGTIRAGWHSKSTKPNTYSVGSGQAAKSNHGGVGEGSWSVNLTAWADTIVTRSDFHGIVIGPGASDAPEYAGRSADGTGPWSLKVTYQTRT